MIFRPGCSHVSTSCTWMSTDLCRLDQTGNGLLSFIYLELRAQRNTEMRSKYQIGNTWLHFTQGHFLVSTISRKSHWGCSGRWFEILWWSLISDTAAREQEIHFDSRPIESVITFPSSDLQEAFSQRVHSRCFYFLGCSVNFPERSLWGKILQLATRCHQMPGKDRQSSEIKVCASSLLDKKTQAQGNWSWKRSTLRMWKGTAVPVGTTGQMRVLMDVCMRAQTQTHTSPPPPLSLSSRKLTPPRRICWEVKWTTH